MRNEVIKRKRDNNKFEINRCENKIVWENKYISELDKNININKPWWNR